MKKNEQSDLFDDHDPKLSNAENEVHEQNFKNSSYLSEPRKDFQQVRKIRSQILQISNLIALCALLFSIYTYYIRKVSEARVKELELEIVKMEKTVIEKQKQLAEQQLQEFQKLKKEEAIRKICQLTKAWYIQIHTLSVALSKENITVENDLVLNDYVNNRLLLPDIQLNVNILRKYEDCNKLIEKTEEFLKILTYESMIEFMVTEMDSRQTHSQTFSGDQKDPPIPSEYQKNQTSNSRVVIFGEQNNALDIANKIDDITSKRDSSLDQGPEIFIQTTMCFAGSVLFPDPNDRIGIQSVLLTLDKKLQGVIKEAANLL